jgi:preprotein translocase subunit SecF
MEILLAIVAVVIVGTIIFFNRASKGLDINEDGKVDADDAKAAVKNAVAGVKAKADVNKDGKVDSADVKAVAEKAKRKAKTATTGVAAKAKSTAKAATKTVKAATKKAPATKAKKETKAK